LQPSLYKEALIIMTTPNARPSADAKLDAYVHDEAPEKMMEGQELATADYSGVRKKTDPKEIRLVRKLDCIMMPTLWIMVCFRYIPSTRRIR
jgi:hypothetical protein